MILFRPINRQILNTEPLPQAGNGPGNSINNMSNFISDSELNILALTYSIP
jgi:hypothetical protein